VAYAGEVDVEAVGPGMGSGDAMMGESVPLDRAAEVVWDDGPVMDDGLGYAPNSSIT
jgi:hypothetical protein